MNTHILDGVGTLLFSKEYIECNHACAELLDLPAVREGLRFDVQSIRVAGPELLTASGSMPMGAWLLSLPELAPIGYYRVGRGHACFEACVTDSVVKVCDNQYVRLTSSLRHDLNNRLNALQMNAELVHLHAEKAANADVITANRRVLQQCLEMTESVAKRLQRYDELIDSADYDLVFNQLVQAAVPEAELSFVIELPGDSCSLEVLRTILDIARLYITVINPEYSLTVCRDPSKQAHLSVHCHGDFGLKKRGADALLQPSWFSHGRQSVLEALPADLGELEMQSYAQTTSIRLNVD